MDDHHIVSTKHETTKTRMDSTPYPILAIMLSKIETKSLESYYLRLASRRTRFVLDKLLRHPRQISTQYKMHRVFSFDDLPKITFDVAVLLQCNALNTGYWDSFEVLHQRHPAVHLYDCNLEELLCAIIKGNSMTCFEKRIAKYLKATTKLYRQVFMISAKHGSINFLECAIARMVVDQMDLSNALYLAAKNGHIDIVKLLISHGAYVNAENGYAFQRAADNGHLEVVTFLESVGCDVQANDDVAIQYAAQGGHVKVVEFLVSAGANVKANNDAPIRVAVKNGHVNVVKFILSLNINVSIDRHSIMTAASNNHFQMIHYICSLYPEVIKLIGDEAACHAAAYNRAEMLKTLYSFGADISFLAKHIKYYRPEMLQFLKSVFKDDNRALPIDSTSQLKM